MKWHWDAAIGCRGWHSVGPYRNVWFSSTPGLCLIGVLRVNVVYLIHTSSLWLCNVKSPTWRSSEFSLSRMTPSWGWQSMKWGSRLTEGLFPEWKAHADFHSQANSVTRPLHHSFALYFTPLIPKGSWHKKSIIWEWMLQGICYKVLSHNLFLE